MEQKKIDRINELYKKSKAEGLTPEEAKEQKILRKEYMELIRVNLRSQLNNIDMEQKDGSIVIPEVLVEYMRGKTVIKKED